MTTLLVLLFCLTRTTNFAPVVFSLELLPTESSLKPCYTKLGNDTTDTNSVKMSQDAGAAKINQMTLKYFNLDCIHIPCFTFGVFSIQVEAVQIALT